MKKSGIPSARLCAVPTLLHGKSKNRAASLGKAAKNCFKKMILRLRFSLSAVCREFLRKASSASLFFPKIFRKKYGFL